MEKFGLESVFRWVHQDVRYAWRGLWRSPSFAVVSVVTLAAGIGINTAVFSVFYAVLMRPLPYDKPEQLARIWATYGPRTSVRVPVSGMILREIEQRNRALAGVAGIWNATPVTFAGDNPEQVKRARVTANFFDVLGVHPAYGRVFTKSDRGAPSIVITDSLFRRQFGADSSVIGKTLPVQGNSALAGVLPAGFHLLLAPDANVPADLQAFDTWSDALYTQRPNILRLVARLKPGISLTDAQRDLDRVAREIRAANSQFNAQNLQLRVAGMQADAFGDVQPALAALFAGATFVLLICCVNVTSLLLARAKDRRKDIALRIALGASRKRILHQLLAEAGVLCLLGGAAGVAVGWAGFRGLLAIRPERFAHIGDGGLMWPVLALSAAVSPCRNRVPRACPGQSELPAGSHRRS